MQSTIPILSLTVLFFQAEDGIRDLTVTGVQTCALPILPLYANVQQRARIAKAQADARALASAVAIYGAHMGVIATALTQLTTAVVNGQGQSAGPFMSTVPPPPAGWSNYPLNATPASGVFNIPPDGDNPPVSLP